MNKYRSLIVLSTLLSLLLARAALAQPQPDARLAGPESTHPPVANKPSRFFGQLGVGPGLFRATTDTKEDTRRFSGASVSGGILVGSRVGRGLALGGAYFRDQVFGLTSEDTLVDGDEPDLGQISMSHQTLGVFIDHYLKPEAGFHWQAVLAYGWLNVSGRSDSDVNDPSGLAFALGLGYDFRVSSLVSLGPMLRVSYGPFEVDETNSDQTGVDVLVPALLLTATLTESR